MRWIIVYIIIALVTLVTLVAKGQTCPTTADYMDPIVYPTPLTLKNGDTLVITSDYTAAGELTVKNMGVLIICGTAKLTVTGSVAIKPGGRVIFTGCGSLDVGGAYAGDHTDCEMENWCDDCATAPYPLTVTGAQIWDSQCCKAPLPIELLSFDAVRQQENNKVLWVTGAEINNDYFTVERSRDILKWTSVHQRDGTNTAYTRSYSFVDHNITRSFYYRLRQIDYDGTVSYSDIVYVERDGANATEWYRINVLGQIVNKSYVGIVFIVYSNGDKKRTFQY